MELHEIISLTLKPHQVISKDNMLIFPQKLTILFRHGIEYQWDSTYLLWLQKNTLLNANEITLNLHQLLQNELLFPFFLKSDLTLLFMPYYSHFLLPNDPLFTIH